jgi:endonuclease-8
MPEGPEIYRAAAALDRAIANKRIEVALHYPSLKRRAKRLQGARIVRVYSRSKALLTEFDNGDVLYSHNQLYGEWQIHDRHEPLLARQVRLIISTMSQRAVLYSATEFAWLHRDRIDLHPYIAKLGPEVLSPEVSVATVASRLSAFPRRVVADALLDQAVIAGLGNYLRADALFVSRIDPFARIGELSNTELQRLARACIQLTRRSVVQAGVVRSLTDYRRALRVESKVHGVNRAHERSRFYVFDREDQPCWQCGTRISRVDRGGRGVFFCTSCQGVNVIQKP